MDNNTYNVLSHLSEMMHNEFIVKDIPRKIFDQRTQYSLGAYRTLFKAKNEEYIIEKINEWKDKNE